MNYSDLAKRCLNEATYLLAEGVQADEYKARKAKEAKEKANAVEAQYQKRYGNRRQTTTLAKSDMKPGTVYDKHISGGVQHDNVKQAKDFSADKRYEHAKKIHDEYGKSHIEVAKEANRRDFEHIWGDNRRVSIDKKGQLASAADSLARHKRRHGNKTKHECIELATLLSEAALLLNDESNTLNEFSEIREIKNPEAMAKEKR